MQASRPAGHCRLRHGRRSPRVRRWPSPQSCGVARGHARAASRRQGQQYLIFTGVKPGARARGSAAWLRAGSARCAAHPQAHALGRGRGAVRAPGALAGDAASGRTSCRRRCSMSPAGQPDARPSLPCAQGAARHSAGCLRAHAAQARPGDRGFRGRRERIRAGVSALATQHGGRALISDALLDEVTALVEWPVPLAGRFEERFLALPRELLISVLQDHQRYFPVEDAAGRLLPLFITVSNIESRDPAVVRAGNERVVRPRLSDAAFFWEQDRKAAAGRAPRRAGCRDLPGAARLHRRQGAARHRSWRRDIALARIGSVR